MLYHVQKEGVKRLCSYLVNARKKPQKKKHDNKFSYNVRYYFTSAKITSVTSGPFSIGKTGDSSQRKMISSTQASIPIKTVPTEKTLDPHSSIAVEVSQMKKEI